MDNTLAFNGLIQHSFALRIPPSLRPQYTREDIPDTEALLKELFATPAETDECSKFRLMPVTDMADKCGAHPTDKRAAVGDYSILASAEQTTIKPVRLPFSEQTETETAGKRKPLPSPFKWAEDGPSPDPDDPVRAWDGFIFAEEESSTKSLQSNDFLIVHDEGQRENSDAWNVSRLLCQLLAHRRSRLFGPSLARGIFNVLLPHAILQARSSDRPAAETSGGEPCRSKDWIVQPALSLFQVRGHHGFRPIFSMTLFMVPVDVDRNHEGANESAGANRKHREPQLESRCMDQDEIYQMVQAGWALASSRPLRLRQKFDVRGPLGDYLSALKPSVLKPLGVTASCGGWAYEAKEGADQDANRKALTLRDITEATLFAVSLRMMQGPSCRANLKTRKEIGDRVLTALSASRVSSVIVVDEKFKEPMNSEKQDTESAGQGTVPSTTAEIFPGSLEPLMKAIGGRTRVEPARKYRLDRDFFDNDSYAIGVLPATRCVVVTADKRSQRGYQESALLEAGWIAYMVVGAATATGMIRSIYYDIEQVDRSKPGEIAEIEREGVVDLHEIFDLDITWETYRHRYRLLRNRLCITREYDALNDKLQALYRETSTRFEGNTQVRLVWLTAAIVILSALILIGTVVTVVM